MPHWAPGSPLGGIRNQLLSGLLSTGTAARLSQIAATGPRVPALSAFHGHVVRVRVGGAVCGDGDRKAEGISQGGEGRREKPREWGCVEVYGIYVPLVWWNVWVDPTGVWFFMCFG